MILPNTPRLALGATRTDLVTRATPPVSGPPSPWSLDLDFRRDELDPRLVITAPGPKTFWDAVGILRVAPPGTWPIEFDPVTRMRRGRSVWEARTNLWANSGRLDLWTRSGVEPVTQDADGGFRIVPTAVNSFHGLSASQTYVQGTRYVSWTEVAKDGYDFLRMSFTGAAFPTSAFCFFDLRDGSVGQIGAAIDGYGAMPLGGGRYLCWVSCVATASASGAGGIIQASPQNGVGAYVGDGVSGIKAWRAQLEIGSFPGPYIPTEGAAVTRNQETVGLPASGLVSPYAGTIVCRYRVDQPQSGNRGPWWLYQPGINLRGIGLVHLGNRCALIYRSPDGTARGAEAPHGGWVGEFSVAATWSNRRVALSVNGGPIVETIGAPMTPAAFATLGIGECRVSGAEVGPLNSPMQRFLIAGRESTNAELPGQSLSAL